MPSRKTKTKKTSTARRRAEQASSGGGDFSCFTIPEGLDLWKPKAGVVKLDIVGFEAGIGNPYADEGELHFERTYYMHPRVGGESGKAYCCPRRMQDRKCPICEEQAIMSQDPDADDQTRKSLLPKQRQLFLIRDHADKDKGLHLWEISFHLFGKLLDSRIKNSDEEDGFEFFYYPDTDGMTVKITFEEETNPFGKHIEAKHIDFVPRKEDLPDEIANHGICLDSILKIPSYKELRSVFLQIEEEGDEQEEDDPKPATKARSVAGKSKTSTTKKSKAGSRSKTTAVEPKDETAADDAKWLLKQGRAADKDDEDAQEALEDRAGAVGLDADNFPKWLDLAEAIIEEEEEEETEKDTTDESEPDVDDDDDWDDEPEDETEEDDDWEDVDDDDDWDDEEEEKPAPKPKRRAKVSASASTAKKRSTKKTKR